MIAWIAFLALCGGALILKVSQNRMLVARQRTYYRALELERDRVGAASPVHTVFASMQRAWQRGESPPPTTQKVEERLSDGRTLNRLERNSLIWDDSTCQVTWELKFKDGIWVSYRPIGMLRRSTVLPPPAPPYYAEVERAIQFVIEKSPRVGLAVAALTLITLPFRRFAPVAHVLIAIPVMCLVAHAMAAHAMPMRGIAFWRAQLLDQTPVMLLMIGGGVFALAIHYRRRPRRTDEPPTCAECGYDLTANESGICPECGNAVARDGAATPPAAH